MIKQVQWSDNQLTPQQVPAIDLDEGRPQQFQRTENQVTPQQVAVVDQEVRLKQQPHVSRGVVESVGEIPNQLYERLGLTMPRWLLWILTVVLGIILSGLLVSARFLR